MGGVDGMSAARSGAREMACPAAAGAHTCHVESSGSGIPGSTLQPCLRVLSVSCEEKWSTSVCSQDSQEPGAGAGGTPGRSQQALASAGGTQVFGLCV